MIMGLFAAGLLLLAVLGIWLSVQLLREKHIKWLFLWIPLILLAASSTYFTIDAVMGQPSKNLPQVFSLLSYKVAGKTIYIWGVKKGEEAPRTWQVPYSKKMHEQLEGATKEIKGGGQAQMQRDGSQGEFKFHKFRPLENILPKKDEP